MRTLSNRFQKEQVNVYRTIIDTSTGVSSETLIAMEVEMVINRVPIPQQIELTGAVSELPLYTGFFVVPNPGIKIGDYVIRGIAQNTVFYIGDGVLTINNNPLVVDPGSTTQETLSITQTPTPVELRGGVHRVLMTGQQRGN